MIAFFQTLLDLFFPPHCVFCDALLDKTQVEACPACRDMLPWTKGDESCQSGEFFSLCVSAAWYEGWMRDSIHRYKFYHQPVYATTYAPYLAACIQSHLSGRYDLLSWIPVSPNTLKKRGYDQARLLAEAVASQLGEFALPTLRKSGNNVAQSSLSDATKRRENVEGVYLPATDVRGKRVLLIDDVITTGSTLDEGAKTLLRAGATGVFAATFCRTRPHSHHLKEYGEEVEEIRQLKTTGRLGTMMIFFG